MLTHSLLPWIYLLPFWFVTDGATFWRLAVGVWAGFSVFFVDRILHIFLVEPEKDFSQRVSIALRQKKLWLTLKLFSAARTYQQQLLTRSFLFFLVYLGISIYVLTSTNSLIGVGTVLGIGLHLCLDLWRYRPNHAMFCRHFLWQSKQLPSPQEVLIGLCGLTCLFFLLSGIVFVSL